MRLQVGLNFNKTIWACIVMQQWEFLKSICNQGFPRLSEFIKIQNYFSVYWVDKYTIQSVDSINTKTITCLFDQE